MNPEQLKRIKSLLVKGILSDLDKSEIDEVNAWRQASPANENIYRRLSDKNYLAERYGDFRLIKERDGRASGYKFSPAIVPFIRWAAGIAAAAVLFFTGYYIYRNNKDSSLQSVVAENVHNVSLSIDNAAAIDLSHYSSGDKIKNADAVKDGNRLVYSMQNASPAGKISMHTLFVPAKQVFSVVLPDGSKVWLDSKSTITYPSAFSERERNVVLSGEGYFEVAKNSHKPFTVTADGMKIKVTGTRFNLKAYKGDSKISAALMDGKISLLYEDLSGTSKEVPMNRGELSVLDRHSKVLERSEVNASLYNSWIDGVYFFDTQTLEEIMNDMGRYYSLDVVFLNGNMKSKVLSGRLHIEDNAVTMLESFKKILPGHIKLEKKTIIIF